MSSLTVRTAWICGLLLWAWSGVGGEELILPEGDSPAPVVSRHFPDRVHEFVWRNWNVVAPAKLAKILGASAAEVTALAESMGLPPAAPIPPEMLTRGYITLIRRNWHLLPYDQLLALLEMTPERLAFSLREDDFLWVKLGRRKPKCEAIRYRRPDEAARRRAAEIRRVVEEDFGGEIRAPLQPRFDFVRRLSQPSAPASQSKSVSENGARRGSPTPPKGLTEGLLDGFGIGSKPEQELPFFLRLTYSYVAVYGDPLLNPQLDPYPDGFLERLSAVGVNGVWLHAVLRDIAPGGAAFPEFGADHQRRLANLRALVQRAKRFGIGVYLYINEPRAMPAAFFKNRPETGGVREGEFTALCTYHPDVRRWMVEALAHVFREAPGLAGVYAITASENLTNCASHGDWRSCERCKAHSDAEILADVAALIETGVHRGNPEANVILSDWGWRGHGDASEIIPRLPKSVWLTSVSEWSKPIERGGIQTKVGEYSMSAVGPGPRALEHWAAARRAGLKTTAEVQFNNTCEIASIPYLPVMDLVAEHCRNLAAVNLDGMMIGWTMGGHPSPNFQLAWQLTSNPGADVDGVLSALARERFGPEGAPHGRRAWTLLSDAYRQYPFHISVVYTSPVQIGPANPLYPSKTGYRATMWGIPYDDLDGWRGPYPPAVFAAQFDKMAEGWRLGVAELQAAAAKAPLDQRSNAQADLHFAQAAGIQFQSVANQARFVLARDAQATPSGRRDSPERRRLQADMRRLLEAEIVLARQLYTLTRADSRIGFEPSCQYFYLPLDLVEKAINCRWLLGHLEQ